MSLTHASSDMFDRKTARECAPLPVRATAALARAAHERIGGLVAAMRHRAEMRRLDRFFDHTLQDIGFERDWGGAVIKRQR